VFADAAKSLFDQLKASAASWSRTCPACIPLLAGCLRLTVGTADENTAGLLAALLESL
jgi:histidinol-phosphate/aromatic aminotransferase/cobyric acid decarboxylase-like protein